MAEESTSRQLSRREMLKKGGLVIGAAAWMTPAMQVIGMTPAEARGCRNNRRGRCARRCHCGGGGYQTSPVGASSAWAGSDLQPTTVEVDTGRTLPRNPSTDG